QLLIGLINGSFYALLSLGLAVIFGMLNIINFAHGAQYMLGAFTAFFLLQYAGLGYWWAIVIAPLAVAAGWTKSRIHVSAELPGLGGGIFARGLPDHLVRDRAHATWRLSARGDR